LIISNINTFVLEHQDLIPTKQEVMKSFKNYSSSFLTLKKPVYHVRCMIAISRSRQRISSVLKLYIKNKPST